MHNSAAAASPPPAVGTPGENSPAAVYAANNAAHHAAPLVNSAKSSSESSSSCCSGVYVQRKDEFKSHPSASSIRHLRMELNSQVRFEARGDLLRRLREEAEQQLQQQLLLHGQEEQQNEPFTRPSASHSRTRRSPQSGDGSTDSQPLHQLVTHPQTIVDIPEEFRSGEYMVALRPEGRTCLLLLQNGKGRLYDKKGLVVFRVQCRGSAEAAAGSQVYGHRLHVPEQLRLPVQPEEIQQLQNEEYLFLSSEERQRLLLQKAKNFDIYQFGRSGAAKSRDVEMAVEEPNTPNAEQDEAVAADTPPKTAFKRQQQQQQRQDWQQKKNKPPMHILPVGILSKGLTLLECILCPYSPANMQYFSRRYAQDGDDDAAAAAAATGLRTEGPWNTEEEKPLWQLLFVVDVLFLGGVMLGHCEFECRHFFLKSKFDESPASFAPLQLLPFMEATASHLHLLFSGPFTYPPDGFFFQHKLSPHVGGHNPFAHCWRDGRISRFPIDEKNIGRPHIDTFLLVHPNGRILSSEGIVVAEVDPENCGFAALSHPQIMHCWVADFDRDTGRFRRVQKALEERGGFHWRGQSGAGHGDPRQGTQPSWRASKLQSGEGGSQGAEGPMERDRKDAAAPETQTPPRKQLNGRNCHTQYRPPKGKAADSYTKLVDQWLRMRGIHPVNFEVLSNNCPS